VRLNSAVRVALPLLLAPMKVSAKNVDLHPIATLVRVIVGKLLLKVLWLLFVRLIWLIGPIGRRFRSTRRCWRLRALTLRRI